MATKHFARTAAAVSALTVIGLAGMAVPAYAQTPTASPAASRGQDGEPGEPGKSSTSITITINGTTIQITTADGRDPVITTNGETVTTPTTPAPSPTPTATPSPVEEAPAGDDQDDEIAEQQADQGEPGQAEALSVADEIFELTNEFRAEHGLPPFERDTCLDETAEQQSEVMVGQMAERNDIFHGDLGVVMEQCPGNASVGENIAAGQRSAAEAVEDWENSTAGHREAMLSPEYTHMGVGVTSRNTYTQQFATR